MKNSTENSSIISLFKSALSSLRYLRDEVKHLKNRIDILEETIVCKEDRIKYLEEIIFGL